MQFPSYPACFLDRRGELPHDIQNIWIYLEVWLCHPVFQDANYAIHPISKQELHCSQLAYRIDRNGVPRCTERNL